MSEIPDLNANNVDPDQTPRSAASDQGLHCLPMSLLWHILVNMVLWSIWSPSNNADFLSVWNYRSKLS